MIIITVTDLDNNIIEKVEADGLAIEETRTLRAKYPDTEFTVRRDHIRNKRMIDTIL